MTEHSVSAHPTEKSLVLFQNKLTLFLMITALAFAGINWWSLTQGHIVRNATHSLPFSMFYVSYKTPITEQYQYVEFWTQNDQFFGTLKFTKQIKGLPGDVIKVKNRNVYVNGHFVGYAKPFSQKGIPLTPIQSGVIPPHHYYVAAEPADSYDSRYANLGLVDEKQIVGRAYPLF